MTQNHIASLIDMGSVTVSRWLMPEEQQTPRLMVVDAAAGTYAARVLSTGMTVASINGQSVKTLSDLRKLNVFKPAGKFWKLKTEHGVTYQVDFAEKMHEQLAMSKGPMAQAMTPGVSAVAADFM